LFQSAIFRRIISGVLLVLFTFSITPKKLLHDILATHTDAKPGTFLSNTHTAQIHKSGINCQLDQLIVESPFLEIEVHALVLMPIPKNDFYQTRVCFSFFLPLIDNSLRGPPNA
jgi:hypothetical protein